MKKLLAIIGTIACVVLCWTAVRQCSVEPYPFMHGVDSLDGVKIELVEFSDGVNNGDTIEDICNGMNIAAQIEDKEKFIEELPGQDTVIPFGDPVWSLHGKAICLTCPDGRIELITEGACARVTDTARITDRNFVNDTFEPFWDKWAQS